jgi:carbon storage regulator CsrA
MLVLSRKIGEQISVPCCDVTIEVLRVTKNRVRLGVNAPQKTAVYRSELLERPAVGDESDAEDTDGRDFSSARILVADPEPCLANSYRQFLARRGFQTAVASNALERNLLRAAIGAGGRDGSAEHPEYRPPRRSGNRYYSEGLSETYYGRQLVQAAVMEALNILNIGRPDEVEIDITVTTKPR